MILSILRIAVLSWFATVATGAGAATLVVDGFGQLRGAKEVNVGGTLYDVRLEIGSCITIFSGCDEATDFTFLNGTAANEAASAILDQVYVDSAAGQFDTAFTSIFGCSSRPANCSTLIPFATTGSVASAAVVINSQVEVEDILSVTGIFANSVPSAPFAVFSLSQVTAIPLPGTIWAILSGLGAMSFFGRRFSKR